MTDAGKLKIAVVGAGLIGRRHAEHVRASDGAALAAIVDPAPGTAGFAAALGVPHFPDFAAMRAALRPDGAIVATPNKMHLEHGLAAIEAGIPVLVEKPIADDVASGARLVAAAEAAHVPLLVGHHRRHNPMIRAARAAIEAGRLGRIVAVHGFAWLMKPDDYFDVPWRRQPGAGPVLVNLIHDIDLLRFLCGNIASVQATMSSAVRGNPIEETCVIALEFASGALGTVSVSDTVVAPWSWEQTTGENPAFPQTDQCCFQIGGTHGALSVPKLEIWSNEGKRSWLEPLNVERVYAPRKDPLRLQIEQFCRVIRGEEAPLVPGSEGLATLRVIAAIQEAARGGARVRL